MTYSKSVLLTAVLAVSAIPAHAGTADKKLALAAVKNYATSIACSTTFDKKPEDFKTTLKYVHEVNLWDTNTGDDSYQGTDIGGRDYLVHWGGDEGCAGGSGTYSYYVTPVSRISDTRPFLVDASNYNIITALYENENTINSRFIESVTVKNNVVEVISSDFDKDECNNCASLRYKYKLKYQNAPDAGWRLFDTQFLGKRAPRTEFD